MAKEDHSRRNHRTARPSNSPRAPPGTPSPRDWVGNRLQEFDPSCKRRSHSSSQSPRRGSLRLQYDRTRSRIMHGLRNALGHPPSRKYRFDDYRSNTVCGPCHADTSRRLSELHGLITRANAHRHIEQNDRSSRAFVRESC